jgi:CTP:phosphocholine cytidylyltransferase-like protein
MLKIYVLIIVIGLVGGSVYGAYYYYKDSQRRIQILTENTAKLETAKKLQDATINTMIEYRDVLINKLRKHDLTKLSLKKPGLVERKINAGTAKLFRSLEVLSGAAPAAK